MYRVIAEITCDGFGKLVAALSMYKRRGDIVGGLYCMGKGNSWRMRKPEGGSRAERSKFQGPSSKKALSRKTREISTGVLRIVLCEFFWSLRACLLELAPMRIGG
jgi:hypothetical protein